MDLYNIEARYLDTFISDHLQPNKTFRGQVRGAIKIICEFLTTTCFTDATCLINPRPLVLKVVKGGSSAKGTALKEGSDADLVVFLDIFEGYTDQERDRKKIIEEIEKRLQECLEQKDVDVRIEKSKWDNPRVLSFQLRSYDVEEYIDFDVLPAFDALGHYKGGRPDPQVYVDLIRSSGSQGGRFSPCFTELQRDFIIDHPTKLKSLIRLLKHWYRQLPKGESLPPKYALELLAVYAWEQGSKRTDFDMAEGFRTVLWLLQQHRQLCIFWTINYDFEDETLGRYLQAQLRKPRPILLDPADPTGIIGEGSRWDLLAQYAAECAFQECCKKSDGSMVKLWDVPASVPALYDTEATKLDEFISDSLQPTKPFLDQARSVVDTICAFLRDKCFKNAPQPQPRVMKIVKGGSLGNGTALKGGSDASLVVFLSTLQGSAAQERGEEEVVQKIEEGLGQCSVQEPAEVHIHPLKQNKGRGLNVKVRSWKFAESLDVDVLLAFDALGQNTKGKRPDPQVYVDLFMSRGSRSGQFSPCFTELQRDFIISRPSKLKSLIRLVKYWYRQYIHPYETQLQSGESLPPEDVLELLAVYAWEQGSGKTAFDMAEGFRTVLWLLQQHRQLCIFWTLNYDFQDKTLKGYLQGQLRKSRPVLLDPADPTRNLGEGSRWDLLAKEAEGCSQQGCCKNVSGSLVAHWDVPLQVPWADKWFYCTIL